MAEIGPTKSVKTRIPDDRRTVNNVSMAPEIGPTDREETAWVGIVSRNLCNVSMALERLADDRETQVATRHNPKGKFAFSMALRFADDIVRQFGHDAVKSESAWVFNGPEIGSES